jgi:hypothetical protein
MMRYIPRSIVSPLNNKLFRSLLFEEEIPATKKFLTEGQNGRVKIRKLAPAIPLKGGIHVS